MTNEHDTEPLSPLRIETWRKEAFFHNNARDPKKQIVGERVLALIGELERVQRERDAARALTKQLSGALEDSRETVAHWRQRWEGDALAARGYPIWRARAEAAEAKVARAHALADEWQADALRACGGTDHGGACGDCCGTTYAAQLRDELEGDR